MSGVMARVPIADLLSRLAGGHRILGVSVAPMSIEVAVVGPPYAEPTRIRTGQLLGPEELREALDEAQATAVLLGGSACFNAAGNTQYGVRKLISHIMGVTYTSSEWLPERTRLGSGHGHSSRADVLVPIWVDRSNVDDPGFMLLDYIRRHTAEHPRRIS